MEDYDIHIDESGRMVRYVERYGQMVTMVMVGWQEVWMDVCIFIFIDKNIMDRDTPWINDEL